ncbi:MAG TPA: efflux RND transporter periplasmic adaptor subunit [Bacteroidia bacterium]|nr:efflux RND transporter periplasmic adaptor subunit [Bacteroidia bacterium]
MKNILAIVSLALFISACGGSESNDKQTQLDKLLTEQAEISKKIQALRNEMKVDGVDNSAIRLVTVQNTKPTPFLHYVEVQAKVDGDESISVSPRSQGTVTSILVKEGDKVTKGQTLATLDDQIMRQTMAEVQIQYDFAKNIFEKQKNLWDQKIGSEVQYLTAKNNKESLEKRLASINEQLDLTRIKSPVNGTVDNVAIKIGQAVMPGMAALSVVNLTNLKVKGEVGESYAGKIKKGDDVILYFPDIKKEINTKVGFAAKAINALNRTFNVEVPLTGNVSDLNPNMVVVMKIVDYKSANALILPIDVMQRSGEGYYVMTAVTEGNQLVARKKMVTPGMTYNGNAEILSGITEADKIIVLGYRDLNEGQEIKIK